MSTQNPHSAPRTALPHPSSCRVAIVAAEWNGHITSALTDGALEVFRREGYAKEDIDVNNVPGTVELTFAASQLIETSLYDTVIVFGCVIRGGTPTSTTSATASPRVSRLSTPTATSPSSSVSSPSTTSRTPSTAPADASATKAQKPPKPP